MYTWPPVHFLDTFCPISRNSGGKIPHNVMSRCGFGQRSEMRIIISINRQYYISSYVLPAS